MPSAIVLAIDRLHAGLVGAYGNCWIRTGQLDRLAAEAFLFDQAYADSTGLADIYRGWWQGVSAAQAPSLAGILTEAGCRTALVADSSEVAALPGAAAFQTVRRVEPRPVRQPATAVERTHLARVLDEAAQVIQGTASPYLVWVHLDLGAVWDAPLALRERYADEEDPAPARCTVPPSRLLPADFDPDELLSYVHAYAGQVAALDECLGRFWESLGERRDEALLAVLGARGFPLGEHGRLGPCDEPPHNETLQQVALWRFPDGRAAAQRSGALVVPADVPGTLLECLRAPQAAAWPAANLLPLVDGAVDAIRDRIVIRDGCGGRAIRTPAWLCTVSGDEPPRVQLFAKPSDRWEVNEVADRAPDIAERLQAVLAESPADLAAAPQPLAAELVLEVD